MNSSSARPLLRVLTWNVHGCVGRRQRFDPAGVLGEIDRLAPDIAALQEIDARRHRSAGLDTFRFFRDETGWFFADARTIKTPYGDYGHVLASRWPLDEIEHIDLSVPGREPRAAVSVSLRHPERAIRVVAAHLGLGRRERRHQLRMLLDHLRCHSDGPALVLGDLNEWWRRGLATRFFCPPFEVAAALPSFPAGRPMLALDRILSRPPLDPHAARVDLAAREYSDHLPVLAELGLGQH